MSELKVLLENCYGIKNLNHTFDFSKKSNCIIYASNGMMKSSFAKTFLALKENKKPVDKIFNRKAYWEVKDDKNNDIKPENIFVIESYVDGYQSTYSNKLIAKNDLKKEYDETMSRISSLKDSLKQNMIKYLNDDSVVIEAEVSSLKDKSEIDFIEVLQQITNEGLLTQDLSLYHLKDIPYSKLFNETIKKFVSDEKNLKIIIEYDKIYTELLSKTIIFKRGIFNHNNADNILKDLSNNGFFEANHTLKLNGIDKEIKSDTDFQTIIDSEKDKVFNNVLLKKQFEKIEKELNKKMYTDFKRIIEKHPEIIPLLKDYEKYKLNVWLYILKENISELDNLLKINNECQKTISEIKEQARKEYTQWQEIKEIFQSRFSTPFEIVVPNQDDVMLNDKLPEFVFKYIDKETGESQRVQRKNLEDVLSQGEKRSLYLLNIIYDLEFLKSIGKEIFVIADDIAESFDYKNKYAIIEYIQELSESSNLKFIFLTHNFDFYRTICVRMGKNFIPLMAVRIKNGLQLIEPKYTYKTPFATLKKGLKNSNNKDIITAIPFIRNLIEYTKDESDESYIRLTSLLHIKEDTETLTLLDLQTIYNEVLTNESFDFAKDKETEKVKDIIISTASSIVKSGNNDNVDLDDKIILSMAQRLLMEDFIIKEVKNLENGDDLLKSIPNKNQTGKLVELYKNNFHDNKDNVALFNKILLLTSENIHINSFMFEPIIDFSTEVLIDLYSKIFTISKS